MTLPMMAVIVCARLVTEVASQCAPSTTTQCTSAVEEFKDACERKGTQLCLSQIACKCQCKEGFSGEKCDVCARGYDGETCDVCAPGFVGDKCDACAAGHSGEYCNTCDAGFTYDPTSRLVCRMCRLADVVG